MIVLACPYCHEQRTEEELTYGGEAGVARPDPGSASDHEWTDYLFMRTNPKGLHAEQWCCTAGCGQWFKVVRHTGTHEVIQVARYEEPVSLGPALPGPGLTGSVAASAGERQSRSLYGGGGAGHQGGHHSGLGTTPFVELWTDAGDAQSVQSNGRTTDQGAASSPTDCEARGRLEPCDPAQGKVE